MLTDLTTSIQLDNEINRDKDPVAFHFSLSKLLRIGNPLEQIHGHMYLEPWDPHTVLFPFLYPNHFPSITTRGDKLAG